MSDVHGYDLGTKDTSPYIPRSTPSVPNSRSRQKRGSKCAQPPRSAQEEYGGAERPARHIGRRQTRTDLSPYIIAQIFRCESLPRKKFPFRICFAYISPPLRLVHIHTCMRAKKPLMPYNAPKMRCTRFYCFQSIVFMGIGRKMQGRPLIFYEIAKRKVFERGYGRD